MVVFYFLKKENSTNFPLVSALKSTGFFHEETEMVKYQLLERIYIISIISAIFHGST